MSDTIDAEFRVIEPGPLHQLAREVAGVCKEIVTKTAVMIGTGNKRRKYVKIEGWQAIANAFNCTASARDVQKVYDPADDRFIGFKAIGEVKRNSDGAIMSTAEGFVGVDEPRWFGGQVDVWNSDSRKNESKIYKPAAEYATRAMAQTRAISRACRATFAYVVVMMESGLSTTPAEEVEPGDEPHGQERVATPAEANGGTAKQTVGEAKKWQAFTCTYGTKTGPLRGKLLGELTDENLSWLYDKFLGAGRPEKISKNDEAMIEGLKLWYEANKTEKTW